MEGMGFGWTSVRVGAYPSESYQTMSSTNDGNLYQRAGLVIHIFSKIGFWYLPTAKDIGDILLDDLLAMLR